jgi:hypothetical protein
MIYCLIIWACLSVMIKIKKQKIKKTNYKVLRLIEVIAHKCFSTEVAVVSLTLMP